MRQEAKKCRSGLEIQRSSPSGVLHLNSHLVRLPKEKSTTIPKVQWKWVHAPPVISIIFVSGGGMWVGTNAPRLMKDVHTEKYTHARAPRTPAQYPHDHLWDFYEGSGRWGGGVYTGICTEIIRSRFGVWEIKCSIPLGSAHPRPGWWTPFLSNTQAAPPISAESQLCSEQESRLSEVPLVLTVTAGWLSDKGAIANI